MRISDWSSDVCSSDLLFQRRRAPDAAVYDRRIGGRKMKRGDRHAMSEADGQHRRPAPGIGRQGAAALLQFDVDRRHEPPLSQIGALPPHADLVGDPRGAAVAGMDAYPGERTTPTRKSGV